MADLPIDEKKPNHESSSLENGGLEQLHSFSPAEEKKLVRKIDLMLLPLMLFAYMMAFLDKQTLSYSALMGLREDLHLQGSQYSWASSIFYLGYLFFSPISSFLLVKFPLGKYLAINFMIWSVILACHAACTSFAGIMVTRFFLGATEASISPGFSLLTSLWYRASEQPLRHGVWFCGNSISLVFGNFIAVGIWEIKGSSLKAWQWLFIIFGIVTFLWGVLLLFRLPDSPTNASFLTEAERNIALERLRSNKAGYKTNHVDKEQVWEAIVDPKTWMLAVYILGANIPNGGFTTFSGLILQGFGFDTLHTLLMAIPGGVLIFTLVLGSSLIASKVPNSRCAISLAMTLISILGTALIYGSTQIASRYAGILLMSAYSAAMPISMAMISSNVGGFTKRSTVNAIFFVMYCAGNVVGPQLFFESEAPGYASGFKGTLACLAVVAVDLVLLGVYLRWQNQKRDRMMDVTRGVHADADAKGEGKSDRERGRELVDMGDLMNKEFRYVY